MAIFVVMDIIPTYVRVTPYVCDYRSFSLTLLTYLPIFRQFFYGDDDDAHERDMNGRGLIISLSGQINLKFFGLLCCDLCNFLHANACDQTTLNGYVRAHGLHVYVRAHCVRVFRDYGLSVHDHENDCKVQSSLNAVLS